jgi:hypothetical protein
MRRLLAVLLVSVVFAACGSSGDAASKTTEGKKYVDALMKSYRGSAARHSIREPEARCLADAAIDAVGVTALKDAHIAPADLDHGSGFPTLADGVGKGDAAAATTAMIDANCLNPGQVLLRTGVAKAKAFAKIPAPKIRCIFVKLGAAPGARQAFVDSLLGRTEGDKEFTAAFRDKTKFLRAGTACKVDKTLLE